VQQCSETAPSTGTQVGTEMISNWSTQKRESAVFSGSLQSPREAQPQQKIWRSATPPPPIRPFLSQERRCTHKTHTLQVNGGPFLRRTIARIARRSSRARCTYTTPCKAVCVFLLLVVFDDGTARNAQTHATQTRNALMNPPALLNLFVESESSGFLNNGRPPFVGARKGFVG